MGLTKSDIKNIVAEGLCTYLFIFVVCCVGLNEARLKISGGLLTGGIVTALLCTGLIYTFGSLSGAHFNPAVTVGAIVGGKMDPIKGVAYMLIQCAAAVGAVATLMGLFPERDVATRLVLHRGADVNLAQQFGMEFILTFILVFFIYGSAMGLKTVSEAADVESQDEQTELIAANRQKLNFAPISIAFTLGFLCFLGGTVSGGAFNPARVTGPAILAWDFGQVWVYWAGDLAGAAAAALLYKFVFA